MNWQDLTHPAAGGAEVHLHEIFKRIAAAGHQVTLLCCHYPHASHEAEMDGMRIIRRGGRSFFNYLAPFLYRQLAQTERFDIVFDDINKIPFFTPGFVSEPIIGIVHHLFGKSIFKEVAWPAAFYVYGVEKFIPRVYRRTPLMVVSPSTKSELVALGMNASQLEIIYNGVETNRFRPAVAPKHPTPLIGYMGRIKRYKSVEQVLQAFRIVRQTLPDAELLIVGGGDYLSPLQKYAAQLQLTDHVRFTGFVNEADKIRYLNQMWVCVNPSPKEGWGVSVIEANACGTPVIAADSPGLRDSVIHAQTGWLYPYGDIPQLALNLVQILQNREQREKLSQNAVSWAHNFTWEKAATQTLALIEKHVI